MEPKTYNPTKSDGHKPRPSSTPFLGVTADAEQVYDRSSSHNHDIPQCLLVDAIARVRFGTRDFNKSLVNFGRVIGRSTCVETGRDDEIVYARRSGRNGFTRFVYDRSPVDCESVVVILKRMVTGGDDLILITSFIGSMCEPEPWDFNATPASPEFWNRHALIWGTEPVEQGTEVFECPDYWSPPTRTSVRRWMRPLPRDRAFSIPKNPS